MIETMQLGQEALEISGPENDDETFWSVTTIIGALDKSGPLKYWAAGMVADAAIDNQATWQAMLTDVGRPEAWKWLRNAFTRPARNQLASTDLGTIVHKVCESYALSGTKPSRDLVTELVARKGGKYIDVNAETNLVGVMLNQFDAWLQRFTPSYQSTEVVVYNPTYGYAGQADAFMTIDGVRFLTDYKTSREAVGSDGKPKGPYPEVALQLSAYRFADFAAVWRPRRYEKQFRRYYALSAAERELAEPTPEVDTGLVIYITPEGCEATPVRCDEDIFRAFGYCQEAFRWIQETSKTVLGDQLQ